MEEHDHGIHLVIVVRMLLLFVRTQVRKAFVVELDVTVDGAVCDKPRQSSVNPRRVDQERPPLAIAPSGTWMMTVGSSSEFGTYERSAVRASSGIH